MIVYDVETLGTESTAAILSVALIHFKEDETPEYDDLLARALFVKFDVAIQVEQYGRVVKRDTLEWWRKQSPAAMRKSLTPNIDLDMHPRDAFAKVTAYMKSHGDEDSIVWARGSLDEMVTHSLTSAMKLPPIAHFHRWRDIRTAIDLLKTTSNGGYCAVPGFDKNRVIKHDPIHDCAYDVMMLLCGG